MIPKIDVEKLETVFAQLERRGVRYGLGAKAEGGRHPETGQRFNPRSTGKLSTPINTIDHIDCSGGVRKLLYEATDGALVLPDGSQNQREWCEKKAAAGEIRRVDYRDAAAYMTDKRLFIAFIRPGHNGCGAVGHVWLLANYDNQPGADTLESHGGTGINSRAWNSRTLIREVYSCFELPVKGGA